MHAESTLAMYDAKPGPSDFSAWRTADRGRRSVDMSRGVAGANCVLLPRLSRGVPAAERALSPSVRRGLHLPVLAWVVRVGVWAPCPVKRA